MESHARKNRAIIQAVSGNENGVERKTLCTCFVMDSLILQGAAARIEEIRTIENPNTFGCGKSTLCSVAFTMITHTHMVRGIDELALRNGGLIIASQGNTHIAERGKR